MAPAHPIYFQQAMTPLPIRASSPPPSAPKHPTPRLRLHVQDLSHKGVSAFLTSTDASTALSSAVTTVLSLLYPSIENWPGTRSITLVLEDMGGVAYTKGTELDDDHKEIHISLPYIASIGKDRRKDEIMGVLVHEMVHAWQWNALGTANGGLIEGIADWVRLKAGFVPPHWKKERSGEWDAGYQHTGYFLDWLEERFGNGTVVLINGELKARKYDEGKFWKELFGVDVKELWKQYGQSFDDDRE